MSSTQVVAEVQSADSSVPQIAKLHGVSTSLIYGWRQDKRFQGISVDAASFVAVEVEAAPAPVISAPSAQPTSNRIEITLENGRRLSVCDGVDASFVLELARGLAA
jgi:transposase